VSTYAGKIDTEGNTDGTLSSSRFSSPWGLAVDSSGVIYVTTVGDYRAIRMISTTGYVTTIAGATSASTGTANGFGTSCRFTGPRAVVITSSGKVLVVDSSNDNVRNIDTSGN
jgi:O-glycosyl hydrolase